VNDVAARQDPAAVLTDDAVREAAALLASSPDQATDADALLAAGMLYWFRYLALGDQGHRDLLAALRCFAHLYGAEPDAVPGEVRQSFAEHGVSAVLLDAALTSALRDLENAEATGDPARIDDAIKAISGSLPLMRPGHPRRPAGMRLLGMAFRMRFERSGDPADLDTAIDACEDAADALPPEDPAIASPLALLSVTLRMRFERRGSPADLRRAVALAKAALAATPYDDKLRASRFADLAQALNTSFAWSGDPPDLDEAVAAARDAIEASAAGGAGRARYLDTLAGVLRARFTVTGARSDIDGAVAASRAAAATPPSGDPASRAKFLANLAINLQERFGRTRDVADLDTAIEAAREAMGLLPDGHPDLPRYLSSLGNALRSRSEHPTTLADVSYGLTDLIEAVDVSRQAVTAAAGHGDRAGFLSNLVNALRALYRLTGDMQSLNEAIDLARDALASIADEDVRRVAILFNLAAALRKRHTVTGDVSDLDEALSAAEQATAIDLAPAGARAHAARAWGDAAAAAGKWRMAVEAYATAIDLLARVAPRAAMRTDQEYWLSELTGLGSDAAACCLQAQLVERAIELEEQGRGVLLGQALDTRADFTSLADEEPELAAQFLRLTDALERPDTAGGADRRRALAADLDTVIAGIRARPRFNRFLLPVQASELLAAAASGPVVVVNVSDIRSDALLVTSTDVRVVPLPAVTPRAVRDQVTTLLDALDSVRRDENGDSDAELALTAILGWLWDTITGPVLDALNLRAPPDGDDAWPRLWWCPTGLLAFLPLHAAGHHATRFDPVPLTVLDRVVSSYTPTLRALLHARRVPPVAAPYGTSAPLIVSMPRTPGNPELPGAAAEAAALKKLFDAQLLEGEKATYDSVTAALPRARWAHFACHATSDPADPTASRLLLHDHQTRPLTVADLVRLRLDTAELAFLSACATARTGVQLADEAIHLAAACQLAGYRHVIATLWPVSDLIAVRIATSVYATLAASGSADTAAHALHAAVRRRRNLAAEHPFTWAAYISNGP
jgi:tetratricopeptide (TPR) repeat protein